MKDTWTQVTPSDYAWEQEGLDFLKDALPDHEPYRAWANFEFIAGGGSMNEVDVLIVTPAGVFLVEIKSHPGEISGDAAHWTWANEGRRRSLDNPRPLAERKAKKLASLLRSQRAARGKHQIPFIKALIFLSDEAVVNKLQGPAREQVHTRKNIIEALTEPDPSRPNKRIDRPISKAIARAMEEAGIKEALRNRRVGQYNLLELQDEADNFQDWLAEHRETGSRRRVRIYLTRGKSEEETRKLQAAARVEFRALEGIEHSGILRALDLQQHDQGPALVLDHDAAAQRLDLFLAERGDQRLEPHDALIILRQIAEALRYAHGRKLFHRALSPQSIWIREDPIAGYVIKIANWGAADRAFESDTQHLTVLSHLTLMVREEVGPYVALEAHGGPITDPIALDVFALGAIAYLLFTGQPPARTDLELQDRLSRGKGLQITDALNGAGQDLQDLVQYATHPDVTARIGSVDDFIELLGTVEDELTRPDNLVQQDPTEARPGQYIEGVGEVRKRLGRGATAVALVVADQEGVERVLKLASDPGQNQRLEAEAETLGKLRNSAIVACSGTVSVLGHTGLLVEYAELGTLARRLREEGAVQLELLERFGEDLLGAVAHLEETGISHRDIKPENIGLQKRGKNLHLLLFDFSLTRVPADNITAGTAAYADPFIRDAGRRRWDYYAERFSVALTLYEMATGTLPQWATRDGLPPLIEGELQIEPSVFDPSVREPLLRFFSRGLARDVEERFDNAEEMKRAWGALFAEARGLTPGAQTASGEEPAECPIEDAQLDTQIGLLPLSPAALDTLSRLNINDVQGLLTLPRNELVRMTGVGTRTRRELSELIERLRGFLEVEADTTGTPGDSAVVSVDALYNTMLPRPTKATDPDRRRFLEEFLGRPEEDLLTGQRPANYWPNMVTVCEQTGLDRDTVRELRARVLNQWGKNRHITQLRTDIVTALEDHGGVMAMDELAEWLLLRRGSSTDSPVRELRALAVARAALETELARQESRVTLRRTSGLPLVSDDRNAAGEDLADYAEALGVLADEFADAEALLAPVTTSERLRQVTAPEGTAAISNHRLLRLAAAASRHAALSSRAEFYPRGMSAARAVELGQGALLGARSLPVKEVKDRIEGRYPAAQPLPDRPDLDALIESLDLGFSWDPTPAEGEARGAYRLPQVGETVGSTRFRSSVFETQVGGDASTIQSDIDKLDIALDAAVHQHQFLVLAIRMNLFERAADRLMRRAGLHRVSFDELFLTSLREHCEAMAKPPRWELILGADSPAADIKQRSNLQRLIRQALPRLTENLLKHPGPILLTNLGLLARYDLIHSWLEDVRRQCQQREPPKGLVLLITSAVNTPGAVIDGATVPTGIGAGRFLRIPSAWVIETRPDEQRDSSPRSGVQHT